MKENLPATEENLVPCSSVIGRFHSIKLEVNSCCRCAQYEGMWGCGGITSRFLNLGTKWSDQLHASVALLMGIKLPVFMNRKLGGPQPVWTFRRKE
jgi:hypothetical protein